MPVNYVSVQNAIREKSKNAQERLAESQQRLEQAQSLLAQHAGRLAELQALVDAAAAQNERLRCAVPLSEALDAHIAAGPLAEYPPLLAADGSQINPNRHTALNFALINIGIVTLYPQRAIAPTETIHSELFLFEDMETEDGRLTEELVALKRDLRERRELYALAAALPGSQPPVTLTDGPLELYREPKENSAFEKALKEYLDVLEKMAGIGAITAGYVDKPASDLVVRLLELAQAGPGGEADAMRERRLRGVSDRDLFAASLPPDERTALFAIHSPAARRFAERSDHLRPCFFYLNVGRVEAPWLVRVELPWWVASRPAWVDLLHATLIQQCRQMGSSAYPYGLHRAHEVALVSFQDAQQIETMITLELRRQNIPIGNKSYKQTAKDAAKRTRYGA
jgi:hypothetical protein